MAPHEPKRDEFYSPATLATMISVASNVSTLNEIQAAAFRSWARALTIALEQGPAPGHAFVAIVRDELVEIAQRLSYERPDPFKLGAWLVLEAAGGPHRFRVVNRPRLCVEVESSRNASVAWLPCECFRPVEGP